MDKIDFRSRGRAAQEALRTQAVYLVRRVGKTQAEAAEAAEAVGVSRQVVNRWLKRHAQGGEEALLDGRKRSTAALLPLGRTDVLGRPWYGLFELSLWMTLPTTRRLSSGGSSC